MGCMGKQPKMGGHSFIMLSRLMGLSLNLQLNPSHNIKYEKHFQKMYRDVGMAVPKTTETRCRDASVQGRHVIQRLHN